MFAVVRRHAGACRSRPPATTSAPSDGDSGPNTGGMGAYSPVARRRRRPVDALVETVHAPSSPSSPGVATPFSGLLFAGLMLTADGPRVLEFNCRFGDPETQSLLPAASTATCSRACSPAAAAGDLDGSGGRCTTGAAVTVVLAAGGYPGSGDTGSPISGIERARAGGALVFHAGTALRGDRLVTNGGRILGVTGVGATSRTRARDAYAGGSEIEFARRALSSRHARG